MTLQRFFIKCSNQSVNEYGDMVPYRIGSDVPAVDPAISSEQRDSAGKKGGLMVAAPAIGLGIGVGGYALAKVLRKMRGK